MPQTRTKRIQMRVELIRDVYVTRPSHTSETRQASREFLSMFKNFLAQTHAKRAETFIDVQRRVPDIHQAYPTRL